MALVGFELTTSAGKWLQTHALDLAGTGTGLCMVLRRHDHAKKFIYLIN